MSMYDIGFGQLSDEDVLCTRYRRNSEWMGDFVEIMTLSRGISYPW
jgi:hypothetical protein